MFLILNAAADIVSYRQDSAAALPVTLTPDGESSLPPATLTSAETILGGTPMGQISGDLSLPAKLQIAIAEDDVKKLAASLVEQVPAGGHTRLKASAIGDLLLVIHYGVS